MKKPLVPLILSVIALLISADSFAFYPRECPPLIRKINLTGVNNRIRGDLSDAVQPFKLRELDECTLAGLIETVRCVYQANCMLYRLRGVIVKVGRDNTVFIQVKEERY